ncbi:MAG: hypothetical protein HY364_02985 [Candidatus Aenigmarchaeota archaeon]|nr:hypothetical protein [Candidatus Aenigmarchaeota archaeon]
MPVFELKSCGKCGGDTYIEEDRNSIYRTCLHCGTLDDIIVKSESGYRARFPTSSVDDDETEKYVSPKDSLHGLKKYMDVLSMLEKGKACRDDILAVLGGEGSDKGKGTFWAMMKQGYVAQEKHGRRGTNYTITKQGLHAVQFYREWKDKGADMNILLSALCVMSLVSEEGYSSLNERGRLIAYKMETRKMIARGTLVDQAQKELEKYRPLVPIAMHEYGPIYRLR